jgi:glycosyltransferase involved in cell wall biosynthesis
LRIFAALVEGGRDIALILTGSISGLDVVDDLFQEEERRNLILSASGATDAELRWLYENCACLCLTSTLEGNFPPQVYEALEYDAPVVATRLPMITEMLGEHSDTLLLCRPGDLDDFVAQTTIAFDQRELVLQRQETARRILAEKSSFGLFADGVANMIASLDPSVLRTAPQSGDQTVEKIAAAQ